MDSKMVNVARVHLPSSALPIIESEPFGGIKLPVPTSINPTEGCMPGREGDAASSLVPIPIRTCTPYLSGMVSQRGEKVVCGSASVACYLNSIVGCHARHVDAATALEAARTGLAHENLFEGLCDQHPSVELAFVPGFKVEASLLGGLVAALCKGRPLLLSGMRPDLSGAKSISAAIASTTDRFHLDVKGIDRSGISERIEVNEEIIDGWKDSLPTHDDPDTIVIGCPHLSEKELTSIARAIEGRRPRGQARVLFLTSQLAWDKSPRPAMVLEKFGEACCDACPLLGMDRSAKVLTNGPRLCNCMGGKGPRIAYAPLDDLLRLL
jgi:predicted aconitase